MAIKIERGIKMPEKTGGNAKYPWDQLKVGESFAVEGKTNGRQLCLQASMTRAPKRFESRVIGGMARCWRVA